MNGRVEAPSSARRRYRDTAFGPVELWRSNGVHGLSADDRHVHVAFGATELTPASAERLREGVPVSLDDEHVLTLVQDVHGLLRRSRVVYVNGVAQTAGEDYEIEGREIVFTRDIIKEEIGMSRWLAMYLGIFGTYRKDETVDVQFSRAGKTELASELEVFE